MLEHKNVQDCLMKGIELHDASVQKQRFESTTGDPITENNSLWMKRWFPRLITEQNPINQKFITHALGRNVDGEGLYINETGKFCFKGNEKLLTQRTNLMILYGFMATHCPEYLKNQETQPLEDAFGFNEAN